MFIDKTSLTVNIHDLNHRKHIASQLIDMVKEGGYGWFSDRAGSYKRAARLHCPLPSGHIQGQWSKDYVLLQADPRNDKGGFLRAEWNPARFNSEQRHHIFETLNDYLDVPPPAVGNSPVTRVDITIDLPNVRVGDFVFERTNSPYRSAIFHRAALQTIYLGKPNSGQTCIYDKGAELGDAALTLTRVEVHSRPNRSASALGTLKNPFKTLRVYDAKKANLQIGPIQQKSFVRAATAYGIDGALNDYPEKAAKNMKAALVASPAPFWQPDQLWMMWPQAIQQALPPFGNPNDYGTYDDLPPQGVMQSIAQTVASSSLPGQASVG